MKTIYNGEIYLKRTPEIDALHKSEEYELVQEIIMDLEYDMSKEEEESDNNMYDYIQNLIDLKDSLLKEEIVFNYDGTDTFWQLYTNDGKNITMISQEDDPLVINYTSIEAAEETFIKLSDFIEESIFIGKEFERTKPVITLEGLKDTRYMKTNKYTKAEKNIVLYAMQDLFLIKVENTMTNESHYEVAPAIYTLDGNIKISGNIHPEYKDKIKVYTDILKQLIDNNKQKRRIK